MPDPRILSLAVFSVVGMPLLRSAAAPPRENLLAAKLDVASASARQNSVALTAWKLRDPEHGQTREQLDDASIKEPNEHYEIHIRLADPAEARP